MQIFEEVPFFKLRTTEKQTINSTYLVSFGSGRLAEGKGHEADTLLQNGTGLGALALSFVRTFQMVR